MRVLVVDDSDIDFMLVERALGTSFNLHRAKSLLGALEAVATEQFDLVILDLSLEDSRGYETFEKAQQAISGVPILILSGLDDDELAMRAVANGAQDYVCKQRLMDYPLDRAARYAIHRYRSEAAERDALLQYRTLFDHLPVAAYTCDEEGLLTYFNQKAVELWGRTPLLNNPADRFGGAFRLYNKDGEFVPNENCLIAQTLKGATGLGGTEVIIELPRGQRRAVLAHPKALCDEQDNIKGAINILVDITHQRKIEQDLRDSEALARSIVDSLATRILVLDESGNIIFANADWIRSLHERGLKISKTGVGANYLEICRHWTGTSPSVAVSLQIAAGLESVLSGEKPAFHLEFPCELHNKPGFMAMKIVPVSGGGKKRFLVAKADITAQKTAERLASEQCGLRQAVAGMEQFLGVVGHELRTPLAAVRAISELLTSGGAQSATESRKFLQQISSEVDRLSKTMNNLLEAARLSGGHASWNWSEMDLIPIIDDAAARALASVDQNKVQIHRSVDPSAGRMLGDSEAISRLLENLVSNAVQHTLRGRIDICLMRCHAQGNAWIELSVQDTGCGISPALTARLGEAFALNSGSVGQNHICGAGLGLSICKAIAAAHGGEIRIETTSGKGTTVKARLRADLPAPASGFAAETPGNQAMMAA
jgi:signal transduction histidine kinase